MTRWRRTSFLALSLLALAASALAQDLDALAREANRRADPVLAARVKAVRRQPTARNREALRQWVAERQRVAPPLARDGRSEAKAAIERIKRNPLYGDRGEREGSNWLQKALARLRFQPPDLNLRRPTGTVPGLGQWAVTGMWIILGALVAGFGFFALRQVRLRARLARKAKALLDESEPERTRDEWLILAEQMEREGRYREAVRCLYLASLLRLDEARVARFDRGETNWEHLARVEASPQRPERLDFRPATQRFDRVWYGFQGQGQEDVVWFRREYESLRDVLGAVPA